MLRGGGRGVSAIPPMDIEDVREGQVDVEAGQAVHVPVAPAAAAQSKSSAAAALRSRSLTSVGSSFLDEQSQRKFSSVRNSTFALPETKTCHCFLSHVCVRERTRSGREEHPVRVTNCARARVRDRSPCV